MLNNKDKYRNLCAEESSIPIFSKDWWLDAVCGDGAWDVDLVEQDGRIIASLPYFQTKKYGMHIVSMPKLTQTMGVWMRYPENQDMFERMECEKEIIQEIVNGGGALDVDLFQQNFHYSFTNWLPFSWSGFEQTTRYTYVIDDLSDLDLVFENFEHAKRKNINKAKQIVEIKFDLSAKNFYENHKLTLAKQNQKISYGYDLFARIYQSAYRHNAGKTIYAIDKQGNMHAALFIIWDDASAYDLISTIDPEYRTSGAASLLVREIIRYVATRTKRFDFEGSMIENVENSFRQFGAVQKPYFTISKMGRKARLYHHLRQVMRAIIKG